MDGSVCLPDVLVPSNLHTVISHVNDSKLAVLQSDFVSRVYHVPTGINIGRGYFTSFYITDNGVLVFLKKNSYTMHNTLNSFYSTY